MRKIYSFLILLTGLLFAQNAYAQCTAAATAISNNDLDLNDPDLRDCVNGGKMTVEFNSGSSICLGGSSIDSVRWDYGDGNSATVLSQTHTYDYSNPPADITYNGYMVIYFDAGTTDTAFFMVTVKREPNPFFTIDKITSPGLDTLGCGSDLDTFRLTSVETPFGHPLTYSWDVDEHMPNLPGQQQLVSFFGTGSKDANLLICANSPSPTCCNDTTLTINILQAPNTCFNTSLSNSACHPACLTANSGCTSGGAVSFRWYVIQVSTGDTLLDTLKTNINGSDMCFPAAGSYQVDLYATSGAGCTKALSKIVTVNPTPVAAFTVTKDTACADEIITFNYDNVNGSASVGVATFTWTFPGGVPPNATGAGPHDVFFPAGGGTVKNCVLDITQFGSCSDDTIVPIEILQPIQVDIVSTVPSDTVCENTLVTITASVEPFINRYQWYVNGILVQDAGFNFYESSTFADGDIIKVVGIDSRGCNSVSNDSVIMEVLAAPTIVSITPTADPICEDEAVTFVVVTNPDPVDSVHFFVGFTQAHIDPTSPYTYQTDSLLDTDSVYAIAYNLGCQGPAGTKVNLTVVDSIPRPNVFCGYSDDSTITFVWDPIPGATFDVNVNTNNMGFGGFGAPTGGTSHVVMVPTPGDSAMIIVRATAPAPCGNITFSDTIECFAIPCDSLNYDLVDQNPSTCEGTGADLAVNNLVPGTATFGITWGTDPEGPATMHTTIPIYSDTTYEVAVRDIAKPNCPAVVKTYNIDMIPKPVGVMTLSSSDTICQNDPAVFAVSPTNYDMYKFMDSGGNTLQNTANPNYTNTATSGTVIVKCVITHRGCVSDTIGPDTLEIIPRSPMTLTFTADTICQKDSIEMTASSPSSYDTYIFIRNGTDTVQSSSSTICKISAIGINDGDCFVVWGQSAGKCSSLPSAVKCIKIIPAPNFFATISVPRYCVGGSTTLDVNTGGKTLFNYAWTPTTSLATPNAKQTVANPIVTTTYIVSAESNIGCKGFDTITVTVDSLPKITFAKPIDTVCATLDLQINTTPEGSTPFGYSWSVIGGGGTILPSNAEDPTFNSSNGGAAGGAGIVYENKVEVTDIHNCMIADTMEVLVRPLPSVTPAADSSICFGDSIQLGGTPQTAIGQATLQYSWSGGPVNPANGADPKAKPTVTTTYQVVVIDGNGCIDSATTDITVHDLPIPTITGDTIICINETTDLTGACAGCSFVWSNGVGAAPMVTVAPVADSVFQVVVTDGNLCVDSTTQTVHVNMLPIVEAHIPKPDTLCLGDTLQLNATINNGNPGPSPYNYIWVSGGVIDSPNVEDPRFISTNANGAGTFKTFLTVVDTNTCVGTDSVDIVVLSLPVVTPHVDTAICFGDTLTLGGNPTASSLPGLDPFTYNWTPNGTLTGANTDNPNATPTTTTQYDVLVTDRKGCQNTGSVTITVNPLPTVNITGDTLLCESETTTLDAGPFAAFLWSTGATTQTLTISLSQDSTISVVVTDVNNCVNNDAVLVEVNELPTVVADTQLVTICTGSTVDLGASGADTYTWRDLDSTNTFANGAMVTTLPLTNTTMIMVTGTDTNTCMNSDTVEVVVMNLGKVSAGTDMNACIDTKLNFQATADDASANFEWVLLSAISVDSFTIDNANIANPQVEFAAHGDAIQYEVIVTNQVCEKRDTLTLDIDRCLKCLRKPVPQIITPNGDSHNDQWIIPDLDYFSGKEVQIFNRWGDMVYESSNYNNEWEGTNNGKNLPDGEYFYILNISGGLNNQNCPDAPYKGHVLIYR